MQQLTKHLSYLVATYHPLACKNDSSLICNGLFWRRAVYSGSPVTRLHHPLTLRRDGEFTPLDCLDKGEMFIPISQLPAHDTVLTRRNV